MIFKSLNTGTPIDDQSFDHIYPEPWRMAASIHFTPIAVARAVARFLVAQPGTSVLDIGSGAGKFCMIGAACTQGHFTGVEQREALHQLATRMSERYRMPNVEFLHANITEIDFSAFSAFYFYNSFFENLDQSEPIDTSVLLDRSLYDFYSQYVKNQLDAMPAGTRVATYFSYGHEIPSGYALQDTAFEGKLKLWEKR